jgi:hypothetical protein
VTSFTVLNDFKARLDQLIRDIELEAKPKVYDPYSGAGEQQLLEHATRVNFLDVLLELLGWDLGLGGNVREEARIKPGEVKYLDYLGISADTAAPLLLVEAKAWDVQMITRGRSGMQATPKELIIQTMGHLNGGGSRDKSPSNVAWYDHLEQIQTYVRHFRDHADYPLPCAVLTTGRWMVIFSAPWKSFVDGRVDEDDIHIFGIDDYLEKAEKIYRLLGRASLASDVPYPLRPAQLVSHIKGSEVKAAFHAVHVRYETTGSPAFGRNPHILVYPVLVLLRSDEVQIMVSNGQKLSMQLDASETDEPATLQTHLNAISEAAAALLAQCAGELGTAITPSDVTDFPGFSDPFGNSIDGRPRLIRVAGAPQDDWVIVTGLKTHYLLDRPTLDCGFHSWTNSQAAGAANGPTALTAASLANPRAYFPDAHFYHCSNIEVSDRRHDRCHIQAVDQRICCRACALFDACWPNDDGNRLPCGGPAAINPSGT